MDEKIIVELQLLVGDDSTDIVELRKLMREKYEVSNNKKMELKQSEEADKAFFDVSAFIRSRVEGK